jgi:hypothetical protein
VPNDVKPRVLNELQSLNILPKALVVDEPPVDTAGIVNDFNPEQPINIWLKSVQEVKVPGKVISVKFAQLPNILLHVVDAVIPGSDTLLRLFAEPNIPLVAVKARGEENEPIETQLPNIELPTTLDEADVGKITDSRLKQLINILATDVKAGIEVA